MAPNPNGQNSKTTLDILILLLKHYILLKTLEELIAHNSWSVSRQHFVFLSEAPLKEDVKQLRIKIDETY